MLDNELQTMWKHGSRPKLRLNPGIFLEELKKKQQISVMAGHRLRCEPGPCEYEAGVLLTVS
jgi:hypothetical protein